MLKEGLSRDEEREGQAENVSFGFKAMLMLAVATSVDCPGGGHYLCSAAGCGHFQRRGTHRLHHLLPVGLGLEGWAISSA